MFFAKKNKPFRLDAYGTRMERVSYLGRADSIYGKQWISNLFVCIFVFIDLFCLKVIWNLVQTENPLFVYCIAFACAMALDVPLSIAAVCLKEYHQGLCSKQKKNWVMVLSVSVFVVAFVFSLCFRIMTRDLSFDIGTSSILTDTISTVADTEVDDPSVWIAAVYNGIVPLLTSLSSFIISYYSSRPLETKLARMEKQRIALQANILEIEEALYEAGDPECHCAELIARENDLYQGFLCKIDQEAIRLKQFVRVLLMEKLSGPDSITQLSRSGKDLCRKSWTAVEGRQELSGFVEDQIQDKGRTDLDMDQYVA